MHFHSISQLLYLSVSKCAMIELFNGAYFAVRPAKLEKFVLIAKMSREENFETHLKEK